MWTSDKCKSNIIHNSQKNIWRGNSWRLFFSVVDTIIVTSFKWTKKFYRKIKIIMSICRYILFDNIWETQFKKHTHITYCLWNKLEIAKFIFKWGHFENYSNFFFLKKLYSHIFRLPNLVIVCWKIYLLVI